MQTRQLGYTDLRLTTVGFGAWAVGGPWAFGWGPQDDDASIAAIQRGLDLGINWIDTAAAYGLGHSEEMVGKAIKGRRDSVIVATKCGLAWDDPSTRSVINRLKAWSVRQEAENSLKRLGVDVIDLYQIHWPNPDPDIEEGWTEIAKLVEEGKIRYAGVSNFSVAQIKRAQAIHPVASLQPPYHMLERRVESELLDYCAANGIGVVAYSPMASGLLTGKYTAEKIAALPDGDWRKRAGRFTEPELSANLALIEKLRPIVERNGHTLGQLAVAWVLRRPEVTSAIVGARAPRQIEEIVLAGDWTLTTPEIAEIEQYLAERGKALAG
jgi:aryl-alcohol dehydrogenase-like predicted oxidoreductase